MRKLNRSIGVLTVVGLCAACGGAVRADNPQGTKATPPPTSPPPSATPNAAILQDFQARLATYLELRKKATAKAPAPKETNDSAKIGASQDVLAATIQSMRKDAQAGDIFTPAIRAEFRRLLSPEMKGKDGRATKQELKEDAPAAVPFKANAKYPETAALPTMPPNLLMNMPVLPKELEYRIIGSHLILRDVDANLIVDYIPNVIR
jgi:hypothetical protein